MRLQLIKYSLQNLRRRVLRSSLTTISILIGIMAIFAIVSFGQGLTKFSDEIFRKMGTDKIIIQPKGFGIPGTGSVKFSEDELEFVRKVNGVSEATGLMMELAEVKFKRSKPKYAFVMGQTTGPERRLVEELYTLEVSKGRLLKKGDMLKAFLGYNYQLENKVFSKPVSIGNTIEVKGKEVEVIGFYESVGNPQDDSNIYLSLEGFKEVFGNGDEHGYILVRSSPDTNPSELAKRIEEKLRKYKNQKEGQEDFFVQTFEQLMETYGAVLLVLNGILALIALISLAVAGVNITNTMYTAVLERTREIGVMKAIGAKNRDIVFIFLTESGFLGLLGGVIGVIAGYVIAKIGGLVAAQYGLSMLKPYFPWWLILGCLAFAFAVGSMAGMLPAVQASRQKPVDALRYE